MWWSDPDYGQKFDLFNKAEHLLYCITKIDKSSIEEESLYWDFLGRKNMQLNDFDLT